MVNIQYLWIEKWRALKNTEFNFTTKYNIQFDICRHSLIIEDTSASYINGFYGRNIELSAFVGKNGVGKTSLLQFIMAFADGTDHISEDMGQFIIVFENSIKHSFEVLYHDWSNSLLCDECIKSLQKRGVVVHEIYKPQSLNDNQVKTWSREWNYNGRFVYYSESNNACGIEWYGQSVLTPRKMLYNAQEVSHSKNEVLNRYQLCETERQIHFISNMWHDLSDFIINYPELLCVSICQSDEELKWLEDKANAEQLQMLEQLFYKYKNSRSFDYYVAKELLISLRDNQAMWIWLKANINSVQGSPLSLAKMCFTELQESENATYLQKWIDFIDYYESARRSKQFYESTIGNPCLMVKLTDSVGKMNFTVLKRFFDYYKSISHINGFLDFNWRGMSSGEMSLLNLFSRLYSLTKRKNAKSYLPDETLMNKAADNAVVILDEAEIFLHPEWQRLFIKNILRVLPKMYNGTNIQLLLATHSPLILSDILKQNIIFMYSDRSSVCINSDHEYNHAETFGANIFQLYHDSFYLDSYIGAFAKSKISCAIETIYKKYIGDDISIKEYKNACDTVNVIGDKLIRQEISRMITIIEARKR